MNINPSITVVFSEIVVVRKFGWRGHP